MVPLFFFLRRAAIIIVLLFISAFAVQVTILICLSLFYSSYLLGRLPLDEKSKNLKEVFNEICMILLLYSLMLLTHYIPEASMRYQIGYVYIGITLANLSTHLVIMGIEGVQVCKISYKRR